MTNKFNLLQAGSLVPPLAVCQISQTSLLMTDAISLMVRPSKHLDGWDRGQRQIMFMLTLCSPFDNIFATDWGQLDDSFQTGLQLLDKFSKAGWPLHNLRIFCFRLSCFNLFKHSLLLVEANLCWNPNHCIILTISPSHCPSLITSNIFAKCFQAGCRLINITLLFSSSL